MWFCEKEIRIIRNWCDVEWAKVTNKNKTINLICKRCWDPGYGKKMPWPPWTLKFAITNFRLCHICGTCFTICCVVINVPFSIWTDEMLMLMMMLIVIWYVFHFMNSGHGDNVRAARRYFLTCQSLSYNIGIGIYRKIQNDSNLLWLRQCVLSCVIQAIKDNISFSIGYSISHDSRNEYKYFVCRFRIDVLTSSPNYCECMGKTNQNMTNWKYLDWKANNKDAYASVTNAKKTIYKSDEKCFRRCKFAIFHHASPHFIFNF